MKTVAELREIAHRAGHYRDSHGDLPVVKMVQYGCDAVEGDVSISYKDIAEVFEKLANYQEWFEALKNLTEDQGKHGS